MEAVRDPLEPPLDEAEPAPSEPTALVRELCEMSPRDSTPEDASLPAMCAARLSGFDAATARAELTVGSRNVIATVDSAVSPQVIETALERRERVIVEHGPDGWVVLGALRTAPTPGVDSGEEFVIKAKRVRIAAEHEFSVASGKASIAVRARGYVETLAQDITTRASSVHKIVGRIVRLN